MNSRRVLFIPDQYTDHRMWHDIPERLQGHAVVIHYDQHAPVPWSSVNGDFLDTARRLSGNGGFDIVVAAGQAARFAFALAETGMAKGVVFFQPSLDSILDDVDVNITDDDLDRMSDAFENIYQPFLDTALTEDDPERQREMFAALLRDTAGDLDPAELQLGVAIYSDHSQEYFADLQSLKTAADKRRQQPDSPWLASPWIDRLGELAIPVTAVVVSRRRSEGEAIARRARDAEIVEAEGSGGLAPPADRAKGAEAVLRMLDRIG
jgi:hypothetical protein